jgi:transposase-like protein
MARSSRRSFGSGSGGSPASNELVISLAAKGLTTNEIAAHFAAVYAAEVSRD